MICGKTARCEMQDSPVRFEISCSGSLSRMCIRRTLPDISMVISY